MKKGFLILYLLLAISFLAGCAQEEETAVTVIEDSAMYMDFYVEDGTVHIPCVISLQNTSDSEKTVKLNARSQEDADNGLLVDPQLTAVNLEDGGELFVIPAGKTVEFSVDFTGTFGGTLRKVDRLVPDEIIVEIVE